MSEELPQNVLSDPARSVLVASGIVSLDATEVRQLAVSYLAALTLLEDARQDVDEAKKALAFARVMNSIQPQGQYP